MATIKRASVQLENGKTIVRINSSAMGLMQTCQRKAKFLLFDGAESKASTAQSFGTLIHKTLEQYYQLEPALHTAETITEIWAKQTLEYTDPEDSPHTKSIGSKMLHNYAKQYAKDPWVVARTPDGKPLTETQFEFAIFPGERCEYRLFGTIDMIVKNSDTGRVAIMDHKTGRSLGAEFMNRWKPNNQISAYILAAQQFYGLNCNSAVINGLQVAKTVQNVCRIESYRDEHELEEFHSLACSYASNLLYLQGGGEATPADGLTCSQYGGCSFLNVCALTPSLRDVALKNMKEQFLVEASNE